MDQKRDLREGMTTAWLSKDTLARIQALRKPGDRTEHVLRRILTYYENDHPNEIYK